MSRNQSIFEGVVFAWARGNGFDERVCRRQSRLSAVVGCTYETHIGARGSFEQTSNEWVRIGGLVGSELQRNRK
jgi:hypothetical protein